MNEKSIRSIKDLYEQNLIKESDVTALQQVADQFSILLNAPMQHLIDKTNPADPIAKQFVPSIEELHIADIEKSDPIGDDLHTTVKGIVHRYKDRCLFKPVHVCAVHCRFCFRKEKVGQSAETLTSDELEQAFTYIAQHKEIWEVILTGGDPLILKPAMLNSLIARLNTMNHVEIIRIHTRIPMVEPKRITNALITALRQKTPIYIVLHANHPQEFSQAALSACHALIDAGIPMLSQTTLLKGVNDDIDTLSKLMRCFVKNRIKPYYLHHADLVKGTTHFRTTIREGQALVKQLRGHFSGLCQPTYVIDIPGGYGKVPIGPTYIESHETNHHELEHFDLEDHLANKHSYPA